MYFVSCRGLSCRHAEPDSFTPRLSRQVQELGNGEVYTEAAAVDVLMI